MQTLLDIVKVPYTTSPGMVRNLDEIFNKSPSEEILRAKKEEIKKYGGDLYGQESDAGSTIKCAAAFCNVDSDSIVDLALQLEEDVAVMHEGKLAGICFCFPSGFIPSERVGLSLSDIHRPVADGEMLVKASPGIARVMTEQPSFRRSVWTVTNNPDLSNHPNNKKDNIPIALSDLYFRYEMQTTARVDEKTSLFFVKVGVVPLATIYNHKILDSINSMSPAVLKYKNLTYIKNLLNSLEHDK